MMKVGCPLSCLNSQRILETSRVCEHEDHATVSNGAAYAAWANLKRCIGCVSYELSISGAVGCCSAATLDQPHKFEVEPSFVAMLVDVYFRKNKCGIALFFLLRFSAWLQSSGQST